MSIVRASQLTASDLARLGNNLTGPDVPVPAAAIVPRGLHASAAAGPGVRGRPRRRRPVGHRVGTAAAATPASPVVGPAARPVAAGSPAGGRR